ncbi:ComF family protein [Arthrobacter burdickii]|uniref:Phosphoribosyltransferase family protein n=1 Tax=Arthrobacter burdickii TaxID=3035920 RepID=A0ABT8K0T4_9MICC|nr:phosphoribosyltransferase family protein [Arthrobacter burdickii]MDN4611030.1 phosphoribosyltransferase family protein [Arthrobacter burdickii]
MRSSGFASWLDRIVFGRAYQRVAGALADFGALVLPSSCVLCGQWDTSLCPACLGIFRSATARPFSAETGAESLPDVERVPAQAGMRTPGGTPDQNGPDQNGPAYGPLPVLAAGRYGRAVSAVLLAYKNHGHVDLAAPVAAAMAGVLHQGVSGLPGVPDGRRASEPVLIVPVPARASSRQRRGYDPLMLLLSRLDRAGRLPAGTVLAPVVRQRSALVRLPAALLHGGVPALAARAGWGGGQKGLGRRRRRANVLGSMARARCTRTRLTGRECIIVDDVLTTGATIGEVHRVLVQEGAQVLGAVVIAATSSPAGRSTEAFPGPTS